MKISKFDTWIFEFYCNSKITDKQTDILAVKMDELKSKVMKVVQDYLPEEIILFPESEDAKSK